MTVPDFHAAFDLAAGLDFQPGRAYWLGRCSELVYPRSESEEEKQANQKASKAKAAEKALRPAWWKLSRQSARMADFKAARSEAIEAVSRVAEAEAGRIESDMKSFGFDRFQYLSGISTQCFVAASDEHIVICFRGTEPNRIWDVYDDLMAIPMRYPLQVEGLVHVGFWTALKQVWRDSDTPPLVWPADQEGIVCKGFTDYLREFRSKEHPQKVWITGHSLGGALATMATARLVTEGVLRANDIGGVYTFGQPRVGDEDFAKAYEPGKRHFRVVHDNDVVTRVPPESLRQAQTIVRTLIDKYPDQLDEALGASRLQYRHVGRIAFLSSAAGIRLDIEKWELLQRRITARLKAPFKKGPWVGRFLPGLSDHSMLAYNEVFASDMAKRVLDSKRSEKETSAGRSMPDHSNSSSSPGQGPENANGKSNLLAVFSGSGIGLLVGLLVALSVSPTVGMVIGGLASSLALILGLNDRYFTRAKAIRIGTFGFVCVAGVLLGTYIRTNELLSPSLESEFARYTDEALGFDAEEAREILKHTRELVAPPGGSGSASGQGKRGSVLFGAEIKSDDCDDLFPTTADLGRETVLHHFKFQGGVWEDLENWAVANVAEKHQLEILLAVKSAVCLPEPAKVSDKDCTSLNRFSQGDELGRIRDAFNSGGKVFADLAGNLPPAMTSNEQKQALLAIRDVLCSEDNNDE